MAMNVALVFKEQHRTHIDQPRAWAAAIGTADPILAESIAGPSAPRLINVSSVLLFEHRSHIHGHVAGPKAQHGPSQFGLPPVGHPG